MEQLIHKGCGGIIISIDLLVYPPIHQQRCNKCGKVLSENREKLITREIDF